MPLIPSNLPALSDGERAAVVCEWNDTHVAFPDRRVHELFETLAALSPSLPAVVAAEETLTYGELDRRTNRLARHLRERGVRAETPVAIALDLSADAVIALLAVWKAGGACVPLDVSWPAARLGHLVQASGATVLITEERLAAGLIEALPGGFAGLAAPEGISLGPLRPFQLVRLDTDAAAIAARSAVPVRGGTGPDHLAGILWAAGPANAPTSGVMVPHRALVNSALGLARVPGCRPGPGDRVLHRAPPGRGAPLSEVAFALAHGAALHLAPPGPLSGEEIGRLLAERAITHLLAAPGELAAIPLRELPALRVIRVLMDGMGATPETLPPCLPPLLARAWAAGRHLFAVCGPAGAADFALLASLTAGWEEGGEGRALGRPLPNIRALVLDDRLAPLPAGAPGELCLAGAGLARGWLDRPDLTAERFLPDPFSGRPGERLCRTGVPARWRADGHLEDVSETSSAITSAIREPRSAGWAGTG